MTMMKTTRMMRASTWTRSPRMATRTMTTTRMILATKMTISTFWSKRMMIAMRWPPILKPKRSRRSRNLFPRKLKRPPRKRSLRLTMLKTLMMRNRTCRSSWPVKRSRTSRSSRPKNLPRLQRKRPMLRLRNRLKIPRSQSKR